MNERKTTAINLRMSAEVKELLRLAAAKEHRTLSNMLEHLVLKHCEQSGLSLGAKSNAGRPSPQGQRTTTGAANEVKADLQARLGQAD